MINIKQLTAADVTITIEAQEEDIPVRGALKSGDTKRDKRTEDSILKALNAGNAWAWCCVEVKATYLGLEGTDYLGCCSYKNEQDFIKNSGYYSDMVNNCLKELQAQIKAIVESVVFE